MIISSSRMDSRKTGRQWFIVTINRIRINSIDYDIEKAVDLASYEYADFEALQLNS